MRVFQKFVSEPIPKLISLRVYKFGLISFHEIDDVLWESIEHHLPPHKPHTGRPRSDLRKLMNGILYVVITGCTWQDVSCKYGSKSTVHRFHIYLCEHGTYQEIFNELLNKGYDLNKIDLSHCFIDTKGIPAKKRGNIGYDGYKKVKGIKLSVLVDLKSNIPVNARNRKKTKRGRPIKVDWKELKKKSAIERFFSWIEPYKKVFKFLKKSSIF